MVCLAGTKMSDSLGEYTSHKSLFHCTLAALAPECGMHDFLEEKYCSTRKVIGKVIRVIRKVRLKVSE